MNFNKLVQDLLRESKPLYFPEGTENLLNDILKWVEGNCDKQSWANGQVKFLNDEDQTEAWILSDYIKRYHYDIHHVPFGVILSARFTKPIYGNGGYNEKKGYCMIGLNKKTIETLDMLKVTLRHEMQHVLDPSIIPQHLRAEFKQKEKRKLGDSGTTLYFDKTLKQDKTSLSLPRHFKETIVNILKRIEAKCCPQEWLRGNALFLNTSHNKESMKASCIRDSQHIDSYSYAIDDQQTKQSLLQLRDSQLRNTLKTADSRSVRIQLNVYSSHPRHGTDTGHIHVLESDIDLRLYIPVEGVFDDTIKLSVSSIEIDLIRAFQFINNPKTYKNLRKISQPKKTAPRAAEVPAGSEPDITTPEGYLDYLTRPRPRTGKIPSEYLPRLDTLLTYFSPERWRTFLKVIGKDLQNLNLEQNIQQYLLDNQKYRFSDGDIILLQHCLRDPYLRRKTLEKITWHINNSS